MSEEVLFYYNPMSRARIVHWMLEEVGEPYRMELVNFDKGEHKKWMFFGAGCVEPALMDRMMSRPAPSRPSANGYGCYEDTVSTLEKALTPGPYVLGDRFSAADVYIGSQIQFGLMMKSLETKPVFAAYAARLEERAAAKRVAEQAEIFVAQLKASA